LGNENWFEKLCTVPKIGEITVIRRFEKSSVKKNSEFNCIWKFPKYNIFKI